MAASTKSYIVAGIETQKDADATGSTKSYITAGLSKIKTTGGAEHEKNLSDIINMTDARIASFGLNKADSMSLSDSISRGFGLNKADSITLSDGIIKAFGLNRAIRLVYLMPYHQKLSDSIKLIPFRFLIVYLRKVLV